MLGIFLVGIDAVCVFAFVFMVVIKLFSKKLDTMGKKGGVAVIVIAILATLLGEILYFRIGFYLSANGYGLNNVYGVWYFALPFVSLIGTAYLYRHL